MTAAGERLVRVPPEAHDPRARLLAGYSGRTWDAANLRAELAGDKRDMRKPMTAAVRADMLLRGKVLREMLAGRGEMAAGP